jgi:ankyrin repeat protein
VQIGRTPLHYAASKGHADAIKLLLNSGADIDEETGVSGGGGRRELKFSRNKSSKKRRSIYSFNDLCAFTSIGRIFAVVFGCSRKSRRGHKATGGSGS